MKPRRSTNLDMLAVVAQGLKGLKERVVFVGGATIELYVATSTPEGRATDDVDCVVEMTSRVKYYELEEELRKLKFKHPMAERAPICRWEYAGIPVDVMPTEGKVLGFNNRWHGDFLGSRDMEDIITVLDGCPHIREEMGKAPKTVRDFLALRFKAFLDDNSFVDSLQGHIEALQPRSGRAEKVLALLRDVVHISARGN